MTKRRRSEDTWAELPEGQRCESQATVSAERATVVKVQTGAVPAIRVDTFTKGEGHQLAGVASANVARGGVVSPRRLTGVVTNLEPTAVTEVDTTSELGLPRQERVLVSRLREEEADVAGQNPVEPHWFWELLAEAGYDVW